MGCLGPILRYVYKVVWELFKGLFYGSLGMFMACLRDCLGLVLRGYLGAV